MEETIVDGAGPTWKKESSFGSNTTHALKKEFNSLPTKNLGRSFVGETKQMRFSLFFQR